MWESEKLKSAFHSLSSNGTSVNAGDLQGNRYFWHNDYMVI